MTRSVPSKGKFIFLEEKVKFSRLFFKDLECCFVLSESSRSKLVAFLLVANCLMYNFRFTFSNLLSLCLK